MAVTIGRTAWTDDDGTGTTGTVINNAEKTLLYNQIDTALAALNIGTSSIVTVGTITTGVWNAGAITTTGVLNINRTQPYLTLSIAGVVKWYAGYDVIGGALGAYQISDGVTVLSITPVSGNVSIGGTAVRSGTAGTNHFNLFNGTPPTGNLTNGVSLYASGGKLYVLNATGTATQLGA